MQRTLKKKRVLKGTRFFKKAYRNRKNSCNHKTFRKASRNRKTSQKAYRGGNYHEDVTTKEIEGVPTKNKDVIIASPHGVMNATEYESFMESMDRNGAE
jgi:hypothetical protein